jgi:hypothetical protein
MFSKILILTLSLTSEVLDLVEMENPGTNLDFGIVREEAIGSTMFTDEVLQ